MKTMTMFVTAVSAVALALVGSTAHAQWQWTISEINPSQSSTDAIDPNGASGGRVNGLGRANATTFYAASEWGGLYRTTDTGNNWVHLAGHVPHATWDVEVDPSNANRVYATSFYDGKVNSLAGIAVSEDGGVTWTRPATATPPAGTFCADAARRTEPSAFGIAIDPANNARVWIGTNCGVARSTNSGATWTFLDPTPADGADDVWDVIVHNGGIVDLCGDDGHQRSTDGGTNWTTATGVGLPAGRCSLAVSPDEPGVLFAVTGTSLRESENAGGAWSAPFTNPGAQGRIPFAVVNQRAGAGFDLWFGDTQLSRATCTTPAIPNNNQRCPSNSWTNAQAGAHWDVGDLIFAPGASDACPRLFSNDGGVYRNTVTTSPGCHTPAWEQATTTTKALWMLGMDGETQLGTGAEDLYFGNQDTGSFASTNAPATSPTWANPDCCDAHDLAGESNRVVYTVCCWGVGRGNRMFVRNQGMTGGGEVNMYPAGNIQAFSQTDSLAQFAANSYLVLTTSGVFVTTNIGAAPIVWTQLGAATTPANVRGVQVAVTGGTPTFYVCSGPCNGRQQSRWFSYAGTAAGNNWTAINPPGGVGGFGITAVDPGNPNRLMASHLRPGQPPQMVRSANGGANWNNMPALDAMMTGGGTFQYANTRGPAAALPAGAGAGFIGYPQPTLVAFHPSDANFIVAGGADSGVFFTDDDGANWTLITDPNTPGASGTPHIPRPWYAYFDPEGSTILWERFNLYIGTQGRGAWRVAFRRRGPLIVVDFCTRFPPICRPITMRERFIVLPCEDIRDCVVRDPIPKNCLVKYQCPGCPPNGLCPPYYHMFFDKMDLVRWDLALLDSKGEFAPHEVFETKDGVVLSFRPDKEKFQEGKIGDYEVVFALRKGEKGENLEVPTRLEVSDKPFHPGKTLKAPVRERPIDELPVRAPPPVRSGVDGPQ